MPEKPVMFGRVAALRIAAAVKRVESMQYPAQSSSKQWPRIAGAGMQYVEGKVNSAIGVFNGSSNTYGSGTVTCFKPILNANTNACTTTVDTSFGVNGVVTCYNFSINSNSIAVNTHIGMQQRTTTNGGLVFELVWADC